MENPITEIMKQAANNQASTPMEYVIGEEELERMLTMAKQNGNLIVSTQTTGVGTIWKAKRQWPKGGEFIDVTEYGNF